MNTSTLLSDDALARATFDLLTSSTVERYARMAARNADEAGLRARFRTNPESTAQAVQRSGALLTQLRSAAEREPGEVELAVLLAALAPTAAPHLDGLLESARTTDGVSLSWIRGLASRLVRNRTRTTTVSVSLPGSVPTAVIVRATDRVATIVRMIDSLGTPPLTAGYRIAS